MKRLEMKNCDMILPVKLQKQKHYHQVKLIETNMLQGRNTTFWSKSNDRTRYVYIFLFKKSFGKTNKKTGWWFRVFKGS